MITIDTQRIGKTTILTLSGRMDSASKIELEKVVKREQDLGTTIILNLEDVDYISTSGLKILRSIKENNGEVHIAQPSRRIQEVLQITGLNSHYNLYRQQLQAIHAISPVVNAHTHLELGWLDEWRPNVTGREFADWIINTVGTVGRSLGTARPTVSQVAVEKGIESLIESGTTTVCDISSLGLSIEPLFNSGLKGIVFIEVIGVNQEQAEEKFAFAKEMIEKWRPKERNGMRIGLSIHSPYSIQPKFWKDWLKYVEKEALPLCIHVAESPAEAEFFLHGTGSVAVQNKTFEMDFESPKKSPVAYLEDIGALALKPMLIHGVEVNDDDIQRIKTNDCVVVHCPRSNIRLKCNRMPLEKYLDAGVKVYLGTDSLGSSPSLNVLDELEVAVALHYGKVAPEKIEALIYQSLP